MMKQPFEVSFSEILQSTDEYIDAVFSCLESEFLILPKGVGFLDYPEFEDAYEALKAASNSFLRLEPAAILSVILQKPVAFIVLRTMLGFSPPEWAYLTTQRTGISVSQGYVRSLDRRIRMRPDVELNVGVVAREKVQALIVTACDLICEGAQGVAPDEVHRLGKADTAHGLTSVRSAATIGVPYAMLLYERLLGRPFASHRDSVSELVGGSLESAVEETLVRAGISFRKTRRAEKVQGFDQAPDFIVPDEFNPCVVIEAKITEDDGTARDKVTRIQHLSELSAVSGDMGDPKYQVIACIAGRGFAVRREDMRKMLLATRGKVFTLRTLPQMIEHTDLRRYRTIPA